MSAPPPSAPLPWEVPPWMKAIAQEVAGKSGWRKTTDTYSRIYQAALLGAARASARDPKAQALADALLLWRQYDEMDEADFAQVGPMLHYANAVNATRAALAAWDAKP